MTMPTDTTQTAVGSDSSSPTIPKLPVQAPQEIVKPQSQTNTKSAKVETELTDSGIFSILKMFVAPSPNIVHDLIDNLPYQTERVESELDDQCFEYSPWSWTEPTRMYGLTYDYPAGGTGATAYVAGQININAIDMAFRLVQVCRVRRHEMATPMFSSLATVLKAYLNSDLAPTTMSTQRALQPSRNLKDLRAMAALLPLVPEDPLSFYDEAPLLRLSLLMNTVVTADTVRRNSSLVQQTFINCVPGADPVVAWAALPADDHNPHQSPNQAANTVDMFACTLDQFINLYTGQNRHINWLKVDIKQAVVVPVRSSWSGSEWLIPYIMSFTTTGWWNFGRTVTWNNIRPRNENDQIEHAEIRALVEACTIVIPGSFSKIILVIIDATAEAYGNHGMFYIRNKRLNTCGVPLWAGGQSGDNYSGFATEAYTFLGRINADDMGALPSILPTAWRELCAMISLPGMGQRIRTMAAELCYTRRMTGALATGINPGAGIRRHNGFLALGAEQIAVDGTNFLRWDIEKHTAATARLQLRAEQVLRHSPLGVYPVSVCYLGTGNAHNTDTPCYGAYRYASPQYVVNSSSPTARLAIATGLAISECNYVADNQLYTHGMSGLLLGMSGWMYGSTGLNPGITSGYVKLLNMSPDWVRALVPAFSDSFLVNSVARGRVGIPVVKGDNEDYNLGRLVPLMNGVAGSTVCDLDNLNVPFWYVLAVLEKFNIRPDSKIQSMPRRFTGDLAAQGKKMAYSFDMNEPWYGQHLAMSDQAYESRHWDFAAVKAAGAGLVRDEVNWYPDLHIDQTRPNIAEGEYGLTYQLNNPGTLQTTMTGGDYLAQYIDSTPADATWQQALVWGETAVEIDRVTSWPVVVGGLQYPDPFWDRLWEGAQKMGPHLLTGNYGMAAAEAFSHLAKPAVEWAGDKVRSWVETRTS